MDRGLSLREQIDACRPGSDDLSLPGLAELAQAAREDRAVAEELDRSQRFDLAVLSALHDVPVPGDLCERLLAQAAKGSAEVSPASSPPPPARSRRWVIALAAVAATLLVGISIWQVIEGRPRDVTRSELAEAVASWQRDKSLHVEDWEPYTEELPPHPSLLKRPLRSRQYQTAFGQAVVFDLSASGRPAFLFKVRTGHRFPVGPSPFTAIPVSGGWKVGAWQTGGFLYVLIVPDGQLLDDVVGRRPTA